MKVYFEKHGPLFFRRAAAYALDLAVVFVLLCATLFACVMAYGAWKFNGDTRLIHALVSNPANEKFANVAHVIVYLSYFTLAQWYFGCTLGKRALGLRVAKAGQELTFAQSAGRSLAYILSGQITLGVGFLLPLFRQDGRTLHDLVMKTDVAFAREKPVDSPVSDTERAA